MGMMFGFGAHRREQLEAELQRMGEEMPRLGVKRAYLAGDLAAGAVSPDSALEVVVVHQTSEPFHRRPDFFTTHLRPRVATHFTVLTPDEFETWRDEDPLLVRLVAAGTGLPDE